jgi:glycerophosphoryl diester phosphodiesterase
MSELTCFAHRGAKGHEPENTLRAFRRAMAMGCTWVELDIHVVEGELIVIHDDALNRTTNGRGKISDSSLAYIRSLDAGLGEQVPTLAEVFSLLKGHCGINVELKGKGTAEPLNHFLRGACESGWDAQQVLVSSFNHNELALVDRTYARGALFGRANNYFETTDRLAAYSLNLGLKLVNAETVAEAHRRDLKVFVYTVNEMVDIRRMSMLGVDGVFSDYPDRVIGAVQ